MNLFRNKTIVLGVTGSIAAYKAAALASELYRAGARVEVVMTPAAMHFIGPLTFESLTHRPVVHDVMALSADSEIEHVALAKRADLIVIAPATANTLAKLASGLAGDAVSATVLDTRAPIVVAPAMETGMWENPITKENLARLEERGFTVVEPGTGHLASGAEGKGRMAEPEQIVSAIRKVLARKGSLSGKRIVITAGGTREPIDPVRVISNNSSGRMGYALAEEALTRGAAVSLITTLAEATAPNGADLTVATTTEEMRVAVLEQVKGAAALIMAAAPADYRVRNVSSRKIKKEQAETISLEMVRNPDILAEVARFREREPELGPRAVVGFAAETDELIANALDKLRRKRLDLIVANPVPQTFGSDTVQACLVRPLGETLQLEPVSKERLAEIIFDEIEPLLVS